MSPLPLPDIAPPPPDPDPARCKLLGPTALVVQGLMGLFVLASLVIKRQLEKRKRPWRIWIWDVGKQLVGQAVIHGLNLLISDLVSRAEDNNPCSLYFLNVLIDTTIGVVIFYFALKGFTWYFTEKVGMEGLQSGKYGNPPQSIYWWRQLLPYLLSIILMKLLVLLPLTLPGISSLLLRFGYALLEYLSPSVQVVFVMMLFPLVMNVIQFCLVDQVIKAGKGEEKVDEEEGYQRVPDEEGIRGPVKNSQPPTPVPRSPLLLPEDGPDYGSTSPRPSAEGSGLYSRLRDPRDRRSNAPSPVSTDDFISPPPSSTFTTVSRLSEDSGREARRSLSPNTQAMPRLEGLSMDRMR